MKRYDIEDPIYRANLTVVTGSKKQIVTFLNKCGFDGKHSEIQDAKYLTWDEKGYRVLAIPKFNQDTLLHELIHHSFSVLKHRGIPVNVENDEVFAYYTQMMFNKICKAIKK